MTDKLGKRPNMVLFWLVMASGLAVVLAEQAGLSSDSAVALVARTVFWCAAVAYFTLRIYQFVIHKKTLRSDQAADTDQPEN